MVRTPANKPPFTQAQLDELKKVVWEIIEENERITATEKPATTTPPAETANPTWYQEIYSLTVSVCTSIFKEIYDGLQSWANEQKKHIKLNGELKVDDTLIFLSSVWTLVCVVIFLIACNYLSFWALLLTPIFPAVPLTVGGILVYLFKKYGMDE